MTLNRVLLTALISVTVILSFSACGENSDQDSATSSTGDVSITMVPDTEVHGWMDLALSQTPPVLAEAGDNTAWLLFQGGNLLRYSTQDGKWKSYTLDGAGEVVDFKLCADSPVLLTDSDILMFDQESSEAVTEALPEGFTPMELAVDGEDLAVLGSHGELAVLGDDGFDLYKPTDDVQPEGFLNRIGPDWIYMCQNGGIELFDPSVALWQHEDSPDGEEMAASDNILFMERHDSIFVRTAPEEWQFHALGRLYDDGLVLTADGISNVMAPGEIFAEAPSFQPSMLLAMNGEKEPVWAVDEMGMTVYSGLGQVETNLPFYETERVSCSLAGQNPGGMQGSAGSVSDMMQAGGGTFRIYESVSIRPDPFNEFSTETSDSRRDLADISVEEFRLVGITLDPVGGDQAMVEDARGVPYVLYEGTELANNSHVAEITSNEVIVIQDVIVDYSARGGGETTIPTIYSLRLHEEGGL